MIDHDNQEYYLNPVLYDLEDSPGEVKGSWLLAQAQAAAGPVLELGCGTARLTIPLAREGVDMTGLEVVPQMLKHARATAGDLPIHWVQADVRNFHLGRQYPLIFTCGAVISHLLALTDREAMLRNVWEHLTAEGRFMLDTGRPRLETPIDTEEAEWYTYTDLQGRQFSVRGYDHFDHQEQIWHQTFFRPYQTPDGATAIERVRLALHYWLPQEAETLLSANGFHIVARYANWKGTPLTDETHEAIFVCAK